MILVGITAVLNLVTLTVGDLGSESEESGPTNSLLTDVNCCVLARKWGRMFPSTPTEVVRYVFEQDSPFSATEDALTVWTKEQQETV